jgi:phosphate starvation-inducible PhoH-like protein
MTSESQDAGDSGTREPSSPSTLRHSAGHSSDEPASGSHSAETQPEPISLPDAPATVTARVEVNDPEVLLNLCGPRSMVLAEVQKHSGAEVSLRGNVIRLAGAPEDVDVARRYLSDAAHLVSEGIELGISDVGHSIRALRRDPQRSLVDLLDQVILVTSRKKPVAPKTTAQRDYIAAIRTHDLTFGVGPAGTGKTYLAMAMASAALMKKQVKRIILTRPAVEAGEKLGFLPGDLAEKVNPYLRPLYDALNDMLDYERIQQLRQRGQIEVAPLAFMRGRTLNDSFVILDEAQNATTDQMKMFLTRLGYSSKAVVTGDVTQTDLPKGAKSGLREAWDLLQGIEGIAFQRFSDVDVVRHPLVQKIVVAYDRLDAERAAKKARERALSALDRAGESSEETPSEPTKSE